MPRIEVSQGSDGGFTVTGSEFETNHQVYIRVVDDALTTLWFEQQSNGSGAIHVGLGNLCQQAGGIHFSATDGRLSSTDATDWVWSNTVTLTCSGPAAPTPTSTPTPSPTPTSAPTPSATPTPSPTPSPSPTPTPTPSP